MHVKKVSNSASFGRLYTSSSLRNRLKDTLIEENLTPELKRIKTLIRRNGLHKAENVDIILGYNDEDKFYGTISSKVQGIPYSPSASCNVSSSKKAFDEFKEWVHSWDDAYSPKALDAMKQLMDHIKSGNL
jgi:hypothetical protein